jgi:hypothetical protein
VRQIAKKKGQNLNIALRGDFLTAVLGSDFNNSIVTLFNCAGKVAFKGRVEANGHLIVSMRNLQPGVYALKVQSGVMQNSAYVNWCR